MAKKIKRLTRVTDTIDCACLIHDTLYDWSYVDKLYRSLERNLTPTVRMHVFTESNRFVPANYVRHDLEEWEGVRGPKRSWWYKIQLFNSKHWNPDWSQMLYFDLDSVRIKFDRVTINVKDLDEAMRFFSKLFDTTFEELPEEVTKRIEITPRPDSFVKFRFAVSPIGIELFQPDPPPEKEGVRNVTWRVDNIEKAREEMGKKGIGHVLDMKCGKWEEAVYRADDMHGVRWVFNEYAGDSVIKALLQG